MGGLKMSPEGAMAIGIIVGLLSTCVQSVGLTLQRKSHMLEDEKEDHFTRRPPYRRRRWQIGMLLFLVANIVGSTIQIVALPLPLLSTLQASGLVFNSILASLLLKEPWTWRTAYGTVLVAAGAVLISFFSAMPEPSHNLQQLLHLLGKRGFLIWFILSLVFVGAVVVMTFVLRMCIASHRKDSPKILLVNGMAFGLVSGVLSAHALLLAKSAVELIVRSLSHHQNQFKTFEPWLLVLAFLFLSLSQLYYLHHGLKLISTSILYPFVFCIYNIVAILDGLIYFQQMDRLPPLHAGLIALGTVLLLAGVLALSWRFQDEEDEEHHTVKAEIPQTVLAPGMGFVGDPDTDTNDSGSAYTDDDLEAEGAADERTSLIGKLRRSNSATTTQKTATVHNSKRRHRATTLREVKAIWEALGDSEDRYGTFDRPSSSTSHPAKLPTAVQQRHRKRRRSSAGKPLNLHNADNGGAENGGAGEEVSLERGTGLSRASTMPAHLNTRRSRSRRKSSYHGSALFSDLFKGGWWRKHRDNHEDEQRPLNQHDRNGTI
jgi:multidrug transporter EmrE-like cation transporter